MNTRREIHKTRVAAFLLLFVLTSAVVAVSWHVKITGIKTALAPLEKAPSDDELSLHITYTGTDDDVCGEILAADKKYNIDRGFIDFCADDVYQNGDFFAACRRYLDSNGYRDEMWERLTGYTFSVLYDIYTERLDGENVTVLGDVYSLHKTTLAFAGAINASSGYTVSPELLSVTRDADITFADNLAPVSSTGELSLYETLGVDIVSLSGTDTDSLAETRRRLEDAGISYIGADAGIRYYISGGMKLALCSALVSSEDETDFCRTVADAASNADVVIACVRFASDELTDTQTGAAHNIVDAGADIVIGSYPGALRPIEYYGGAPVIFGLGSFSPDADAADTAILTVSASVGITPVLRLYPCVRSDGDISLADEDNTARVIGMMNLQSSSADIGEDNRIRER